MTASVDSIGAERIGTRHVPDGDHPLLRPRDAAALIVIDRTTSPFRALMGRRARQHVFMPDVYVFPGGKRDAADLRRPVAEDLDPAVLQRLTARTGAAFRDRHARALAVAALRELQEETGLSACIDCHSSAHHLAPLRFIARAITPPRQVRRYDTRFFAGFLDEIGADPADVADSSEMLDLRWVPIDATDDLKVPTITRTILGELRRELAHSDVLPPGRPVPFFHVRHGLFTRDMI
jgi:8-oxo-dGTP pyrophosphatase MutT (NUDIX family)